MKPFHSLVGLVAQSNSAMARQSINFIPVNFMVMGGLLLGSYFAGGMVVQDHVYLAALAFIPFFGLFSLYVLSTFKLNTFFAADGPGAGDARPNPALVSPVSGATVADVLPVRAGFSGKLRLDPKTEQRFLNMPALATELENGTFAFASNIDASSRMYNAVTKSRVGTWISLPDLQSASFENGTLLHGKSPSTALRMKYQENSGGKPKSATAILSFATMEERDTLRTYLQGQAKALAGTPAAGTNTASAFNTSSHA